MNNWLKHNYLWLSLLATFAGFAAAPLYRHIFTIFAITGLYLLIKQRKTIIHSTQIRHFSILFVCLWIPMAISLVDAEFLNRSLSTTLRFLGYLFAAISIIHLARQQSMDKLLMGCYGVMLFLSLDGLLQWLTGTNILGYPAYRDLRIVGMFFPEPYLSLFLATFSPLFLEASRQLQQRFNYAWLGFLPFIAIIVLGGSRTAWMLFAIAFIVYGIYFLQIQKKINWRRLALQSSGVAIALAIAISQSSYIQTRIELASGLFSGDYQQANQATSARLPLWQTAIKMTEENWFNGVGPRAFTLSYDQYSDTNDYWHNRPTGQPHLYILEISSETGLVGVIGYLTLLALLLARLWKLSRQGAHPAIPWGIAALIAGFPLGAAMPIFGYFAAQLFWFPLIIFFALQSNTSR